MIYSGLEGLIDIVALVMIIYGIFRLIIKNNWVIFFFVCIINILVNVFLSDIHNSILFIVNGIFFLLVLYGKTYQRIITYIFAFLVR